MSSHQVSPLNFSDRLIVGDFPDNPPSEVLMFVELGEIAYETRAF
jgi:hypothetical protein